MPTSCKSTGGCPRLLGRTEVRVPRKRAAAVRRRLLLEPLEERTMLSGGRPVPVGSLGDNVAAGCSYTWNSQPNASACTDSGDTTQLTDGQYTAGEFWSQQSTVGWQGVANPVEITIDLGMVQPIQGVSFNTAGGAGVAWPTAINVQMSNDNLTFYDVADLVGLDPNPPADGTYAVHRYAVADQLATHGRFVKFQIVSSSSVYVDEIEVYRGADALLGQNVALGCSYTLNPIPKYSYCTGSSDATDLTDGVFTNTRYTFWKQQSTVGWSVALQSTGAQVTIDLGTDQPIEGLAFHTAAGSAGVNWPTTIAVLVSTDGVNFYDGGELVSLSAEHGLPELSGYTIRSYWTDRLATHGRYVCIAAVAYPYLFCDEIEVYRGRDEMLSQSYQGNPITDLTAYLTSSEQHAMKVRRIVLDAQNVKQQVDATAQLTPAQKSQLDQELTGCIQQAIYDNPSQIVLPMDPLHAQVYAVQAAVWRAQGVANLSAWATSSAWDQIVPTDSPLGKSSASINVSMMQNEFRGAAFNLSNASADDLDVSLTFAGLLGGLDPSYVSVQVAEWTDTQSGIPNLAALPDVSFDSVQNAFVIHVPSGMTRQVWLTFHPTGDVSPGTYTGSVVVDGGAVGTVNVPVQLRVSTQTFSTQPSLSLGAFDYTDIVPYREVTASNRDAFIALLHEHFVDTPWGHYGGTEAAMRKVLNPTDFSGFDQWIARWPDARQYLIFLSVGTSFGGYQMGTTEFNNVVKTWISAYVAHWRQIGLDPSKVGLYLLDEPDTASEANIVIAWANAIKAAAPEVQIWETMHFANPSEGAAMDDVCDVLCAQRPPFLAGTDEYRDFVRQQLDAGKTLNFYSSSGPTESYDPYSYYRLQAWTCFQEGATAEFFWSASDQASSDWRTSYPKVLCRNYSPLFLDPTGVTDGKAMEAIREGVEDYQYLQMLGDRIDQLETAGVQASALADAKNLLASSPSTVLGATNATDLLWADAKDRTVADTVRIQILDMLEQLNPPIVTNAHITISGATGTGGIYHIGDTVTAAWDNTDSGDNAGDIASVSMDFSQFGGTTMSATNHNGIWTASYTILAGTINATNCNVFLTAVNPWGTTTVTDNSNAAIDNIRPTVQVKALPQRQSSLSFTVSVTGSDPAVGGVAGSGLASHDVYVMDNGGAWTLWRSLLASSPSALFTGQSNHSYGFYALAHDAAGNVESQSPAIEAGTYVPDLTAPVTSVTSVDSTSSTFTVYYRGTDAGGSGVTSVQVLVQVDGGTATTLATLAASGNSTSGQVTYQALADGTRHSYRFYTLGTDGNGNLETAPSNSTQDVLVSASFASPEALAVTAFDVQKGALQRSFVRYLDVTFNDTRGLSTLLANLSDRVHLRRFELNGSGSGADVSLVDHVKVVDHVLAIDLGTQGIGGNANSNVGDGYYALQFDLDGNGTFETVRHFYRLLGDANGDCRVDAKDTGLIGLAIGRRGTNLNEDLNGDGVVNSIDRTLAQRAIGRCLASGLGVDD